MKKTFLSLLMATLLFCTVHAWVSSAKGPGISPDEALNLLKEGNDRFVSYSAHHPNADKSCILRNASQGQAPFATVLSCSDSRVPVEIIFDRGIGDIFVIRVAGNVTNVDEAGSIEYGVDHLGTPVMIVLGHTRCGAVTAVAKKAEVHGNIAELVKNIKPAVEEASKKSGQGDALIEEAIKINVWQSMKDLFKASEAMRAGVKAGKVKVIGALYNIETGAIEWMGPHPDQDKLIAQ